MAKRTNLESLPEMTMSELAMVRAALNPVDGSELDEAMSGLETFCAVALRIMARTNPSIVKDVARTVEIGLRMKPEFKLKETV